MVDLTDLVCGCEPTVNVNMRYRIYRHACRQKLPETAPWCRK